MKGRQPGAKDKQKPHSGRHGEISKRFLNPRQPGGHPVAVPMNQGMPPIAGAGGGPVTPSVGGQGADDMTNIQGGGLS